MSKWLDTKTVPLLISSLLTYTYNWKRDSHLPYYHHQSIYMQLTGQVPHYLQGCQDNVGVFIIKKDDQSWKATLVLEEQEVTTLEFVWEKTP